MKQIITFLLLVILPFMAFAQGDNADDFYNRGNELLASKKYEDALALYEKSYALYKAQNGDTLHVQYAMIKCIDNLIEEYKDMGKHDDVIRVGLKEKNILKNILGEKDQTYAVYLIILADHYADAGNIAEAIKLDTQAANFLKNDTTEGSDKYYDAAIFKIIGYNEKTGNFSEAIKTATQALEIFKKIHGENSREYATLLDHIANGHSAMGKYTEAVRVQTQTIQCLKAAVGDNNEEYATALNNMSAYYHYIGDNDDAIKYGTQALEIRERLLGKNHPDCVSSLNNLAACYSDIGNNDEAIRLATRALEIRKNTVGENHPDYAVVLNNLSNYYSEAGRHEEAKQLSNQSLTISKEASGEENRQYAVSLGNVAMQNYNAGNYDEAYKYATKSVEIMRKLLGEAHPDCTVTESNLAAICFALGKYDEATKLIQKIYDADYAFVRKNFAMMTYKERANFWNKFSALYSVHLPYYAYKHPVPELAKLAYDGQVLTKGLLLNSELELHKIIEKKGDKNLMSRYNSIMTARATLDKLYATQPEQRSMDADSLLSAIEKDELKLVESCQELGDYTQNISIKWNDIQQKIIYGDIAIEFARYYDTQDQQWGYIAIIIKKGMNAPAIVKLFDEDQLLSMYIEDLYGSAMYDLVWKPLEKHLQGVKDVYFSPSGILHALSIEYLPCGDGTIFAEKYNAFRMSSTRELAVVHPVNTNRKAASYGGIIYNGAGGDVPGGAEYVSCTKDESDAVAKSLRLAKYSVTALSGEAATEESFKKLSGSGLKIIHISTHGFYYSEDQNNAMEMSGSTDEKSKEERYMTYSGLLFAGANAILTNNGNDIPEGADDGILTAKEISRLDFGGLDLVVLSACESGLGKITGEGVFGLQRGFKKAGAKTIIMTLWSVAGEVSNLLISEFFKNLTGGRNKRAAFIAAQKVVREKYPEPLLWAAFVMVDGF